MKSLVYGPVNSLRYGTTLGVNILGAQKICSFNCGYCDLGTTELTLNYARKEYQFPSIVQITAEFKAAVSNLKTQVDAVVVSGNGEPTLHPEFEEIILELQILRKELVTGKPIVVLTNGAHLDVKKVVSGLNNVDERVIKLDAGNDNIFRQINGPLVRTNLAKIMNGIKKLTDCTIQSMFVQGAVNNITNEAIDEWIEVVGILQPKQIQLMTLTRKPWNEMVQSVNEDMLYTIAHKLKKRTQLEANVYVAKS